MKGQRLLTFGFQRIGKDEFIQGEMENYKGSAACIVWEKVRYFIVRELWEPVTEQSSYLIWFAADFRAIGVDFVRMACSCIRNLPSII